MRTRIVLVALLVLGLTAPQVYVTAAGSDARVMHQQMANATGPSAKGRAKRPLFSGQVELRFRGLNYATSRPASGPGIQAIVREGEVKVNQDFSNRPQNETAIAVNPLNQKNLVVGMNDYRVGTPIGGGFATSLDGGMTWVDGLLPFPLLSNDLGVTESPAGTGDMVVDFQGDGTAFQTSLGFSFTFCNNGLFAFRSENRGRTWTRPVIPEFAPPTGLRTIVYWDRGADCKIFHDKEWMAIDRTGGPHDGRIYVTWSRFVFTPSFAYLRSSIYLAYSDDDGNTWTVAGEINGQDKTLCTFQADGETGGRCDENQASVPVVLPDGTLVVAFINEQNKSLWESGSEFDDQYLVVRVNPDTFAVDGPFQAAGIEDGLDDLPINNSTDVRQTICEANFRLWSVGNIFYNPGTGKLHLVFMSHEKHNDSYPFPTYVNASVSPAASSECPGSVPETDTDIRMVTSSDGGMTWSAPVDVGAKTNRDQFFPFGTADASGRIYVTYFDRRYDPDNKLVNATLSVSPDDGATWTDFRASTVSSDMDFAFTGGRFIGDYNGIATNAKKIFPIWTDARFGTASVRHSDIFMGIFSK